MNRKHGLILGGVVAAALVAVVVFSSDPEDGNGATFQVGTIKANNNTSTTSSYSSSDDDLFLARRVAVISDSAHPVMKSAVRGLVEALRALPFVEEVDAFTEDRPAAGGLTHDLYLLLEMPKFESRGLLATGRKVNAEIKCSIGRGLWNSRHRYSDRLSPALVDPYIGITVNHESVSRGLESPNAKYKLVADDVTKQLVQQATKPLSEFAAKFRAPAQLPAGLYPPYRPSPALPPPWNERLVERINGRGFMLHNHTVHTAMTTTPYEDLKATRELLKERGWRLDSKTFDRRDEHDHHYYRATLDHLVVEAFEARDFGPRATNEETRLVFRYSDRMTKEEVGAVFAEAYGDDLPMDLWLSFNPLLPKETNERVLARLATRSNLSTALETRVIRHLEKTGRGDAARARLRPAYFAASLEDPSQAKAVLKLGREIMDDKEWEPEDPTLADIDALNLQRAEPGESFERDVALGEPARYHVGPANEFKILAITVKRSAIPEGRFTLASGSFSVPEGARDSSSVTPHGTNQPWSASMARHAGGVSWRVEAEEIGDDRFTLKIEGRE